MSLILFKEPEALILTATRSNVEALISHVGGLLRIAGLLASDLLGALV
jgi:hypothetical protein